MQKEMKKAFVFVMGMMLLTVELTSCKYFKSLDGPGMERDSATLAAMDSMAIKGKEVQSSLTESMQSNLAEPQEDVSELTYANMNGVYDSLDEDMNLPRISGVMPGTPAERAELMTDDIIYEYPHKHSNADDVHYSANAVALCFGSGSVFKSFSFNKNTFPAVKFKIEGIWIIFIFSPFFKIIVIGLVLGRIVKLIDNTYYGIS